MFLAIGTFIQEAETSTVLLGVNRRMRVQAFAMLTSIASTIEILSALPAVVLHQLLEKRSGIHDNIGNNNIYVFIVYNNKDRIQ